MEKTLRHEAAFEKLKAMATDIQFCMFCTIGYSGTISSRPMTTNEVDGEGNIWFFTNKLSEVSIEADQKNNVCLAYACPSKNDYLSVTGVASVVLDRAKIKELWKPAHKVWFPEGVDDPELALIKVSPVNAEYWDSSANKMVILFSMVKAALTGTTYNEGEHGKLRL
ncbi:MAG TPA: pyridoxamine 5'-phosphate oxidase family protein [Bacteroidia bacterium]|jgi:general stress protein 26|nr:pyridoxamine 5'-phosphate oxidase family protein [Bacteroidia bacterium]